MACLFRDTADISQTSPAFRVRFCTIAPTLSFLGHDLLHDRRAAVLFYILSDVISSMSKTVTDKVIHNFFLLL
jgi:hypothetical protein